MRGSSPSFQRSDMAHEGKHLLWVGRKLYQVGPLGGGGFALVPIPQTNLNTTYIGESAGTPKTNNGTRVRLPTEIWTRIGLMLVMDALERRDFAAAGELATEFQRDVLCTFHRSFVNPKIWSDEKRRNELSVSTMREQTNYALEFLESIIDEGLSVVRSSPYSQDICMFEVYPDSEHRQTYPWELRDAERCAIEQTASVRFKPARQGAGVVPKSMVFRYTGPRVCDQIAYTCSGRKCSADIGLGLCATDVFHPMIVLRILGCVWDPAELDREDEEKTGFLAAWEGFAAIAKVAIPGCSLFLTKRMGYVYDIFSNGMDLALIA